MHLPNYKDLLSRTDAPPGSSWGLFDSDPERGMANFSGPEAVRNGAATIRSGAVFNLDYPVDAFVPSVSRRRIPPVQTIIAAHPDSFDDFWDGYWPQVSTHVDGLRHRRAHGYGFYNAVPDTAVSVDSSDLGIQSWSQKPIAGRAVLVDIHRHRQNAGFALDHESGEALELSEITDALAAQGTVVEPGDILLLHTGWAEWFLALDVDERQRARETRRTTGVAQSTSFLEWIWNNRIALLGTDTFAVEALPPRADSPFRDSAGEDGGMMHQELIAKLGCPLGELWHLAELAEACGQAGRYAFFASVKPLNLPGAVGSPANAMAIL